MCSHCDNADPIIDVRTIAPRMRHATIFMTFEALPDGEAFVIVNDHDPVPLWYQFNTQYSGKFEWIYEHHGPELWQVRIRKAVA
ncbi:DUF2249 domain-containing protein [Devosia sp. RR2S18]|uniref:DUF2249 domain-containing protein n=1 Tax=Devosia rhizosphaerae TaxID=3049774 RepID=UPI002541B77E|nr:DUF2249 domain-containing protein [Devosia sp. RR2S18]WIJ26982.1 DUF2249 domain-containing protein [Devosia sp. RR2S18]